MLKRKIKIILIGLFSLLFLGLVYGLFSAKPEIIADDNLRVEEPEIPGMQSQVDRAVNANSRQLSPVGNSQIESSLEGQLIDQQVANSQNEVASLSSDASNNEGSLDKESSELAEDDDEKKALRAELSTESEISRSESIERMMAQSVSPFRDDAIIQRSKANQEAGTGANEFLVFEKAEGVALEGLPKSAAESQPGQDKTATTAQDASVFLDLNLSEVKPKQQKAVLAEKDQLIVDDINKKLGKYKPAISEVPDTRSAVKEELDIQVSPASPSVFTLPKVDQDLMQGNSEVSMQYRKTMAKLISIKAKLRDADEENADLQGQFEMVVTQNRQLAQIIRDIDTQIKTFYLN